MNRICAMRVFVSEIQNMADIKQYWASGKGAADPFMFWLEALHRFTVRSNLMKELEVKEVRRICKDAKSA